MWPVVIALPEDVLTEMAAVADAPRYQIIETHPGLTQMAELQKLLHGAKNPIALLGGSRWSETAVQRFVRRRQVSSAMPATNVRDEHPSA